MMTHLHDSHDMYIYVCMTTGRRVGIVGMVLCVIELSGMEN